jgi:hypothetical protein
MNIGILYIGIGRYSIFWPDFFSSAEKFLFPEVKKNYYVFTDDECLLSAQIENVHFIKQEDLGWPGNSLYRYRFFKNIEENLFEMDFLFFFNGNYLFVKPIRLEELLPGENNDHWTALVWHTTMEKEIAQYTYERNPQSKAFIPYGEGKFYFQGGFYGSDKEHFFDLINTCDQWTEEDLKKNIIPVWNDESYLNRYMLDKNPKILGTEYGKPVQWKYPLSAKAILRNKKKVFGKKFLKHLKNPGKKPFFVFRLFNRLFKLFIAPALPFFAVQSF